MPSNHDSIAGLDKLRQKAEERVKYQQEFGFDVPTDPLELAEEFKIYQAELVIQNEELRRAQQELADLLAEYVDLYYDSAPCGYLTLNPYGMITRINLSGAQLLGMEKRHLRRKPFSQLIDPQTEAAYYQALQQTEKSDEKHSMELKLNRENSSSIWCWAEIQADRMEIGRVIQRRMVLVDITEYKMMEAQLRQAQKMESISTLAGGIAHDFNNLLFMILGNTELALDDISENTRTYKFISEIQNSVKRGTEIVNNLLNFSRNTFQNFQPFDLISIVEEMVQFTQSTFVEGIEFRVRLPQKGITMRADPCRIRQAILNLCINACQAMEPTGGVLDIQVREVTLDDADLKIYPDLKTGDYVKITVRDTGPGIAPEHMDRIFDPYFTTKEVGKGSGMGLAVVHGIVKSHNGAVSVRSQPKEGATFTLLFPIIGQ